jgi:GT2 family glycosyltransferase
VITEKVNSVIVNWNSGSQLRESVDSILVHNRDDVPGIIVVDNGSTDGSAETVEGLPSVEVIRTGKNLGFAAACNIGARACDSRYILFLNPDTRVEANSLSVPLTFMEQADNGRVGICGIQLVDEQGKVSKTCAQFPTFLRLVSSALGLDKLPGLKGSGMRMSNWGHQETRQVDQVMGAFFLIRKQVFDTCGGFDERFFEYFEEVDLARRVKLAGSDSWYLADARAFHAGGGTSRHVKAKRLFYSLRSRLLYGFKHFPSWQAWLLVAVTGLIEPFTRTAWCAVRCDGAGVRQTWSAYRMLWRGIGRIIRGEGRWNS